MAKSSNLETRQELEQKLASLEAKLANAASIQIAEILEEVTELLNEAQTLAKEAGVSFEWKGPEGRGSFVYDPDVEVDNFSMDRIHSNWTTQWINSKGKC